jgi:hypothetical protein
MMTSTIDQTATGITMIRHDGEIVAFATARQIAYAGRLSDLPSDHAERRFVYAMGVYASHVMTGELVGPYTDEHAELFARTLLEGVEQPG